MNEDTEMIDHDRNRTNGLNGHRDTHGQPVDSNEDGMLTGGIAYYCYQLTSLQVRCRRSDKTVANS